MPNLAGVPPWEDRQRAPQKHSAVGTSAPGALWLTPRLQGAVHGDRGNKRDQWDQIGM